MEQQTAIPLDRPTAIATVPLSALLMDLAIWSATETPQTSDDSWGHCSAPAIPTAIVTASTMAPPMALAWVPTMARWMVTEWDSHLDDPWVHQMGSRMAH